MDAIWTFGEVTDFDTYHKDGTVTPTRSWTVYMNGQEVGSVEVAMTKRRGKDQDKPDVTFTITPNIYG